MYEVKFSTIYKIIIGGLIIISAITFLSFGIYNLFFTKIGGLWEMVIGILSVIALPSIFAKHIILPNKKIIYYNGYWVRKEIVWSDIASYKISKEEVDIQRGPIDVTSYERLILYLYNKNGNKLTKINVRKENGNRLLSDIQKQKNIKRKR